MSQRCQNQTSLPVRSPRRRKFARAAEINLIQSSSSTLYYLSMSRDFGNPAILKTLITCTSVVAQCLIDASVNKTDLAHRMPKRVIASIVDALHPQIHTPLFRDRGCHLGILGIPRISCCIGT